MNITFHEAVYKQLQQLPRPVFAKVLNAIIALANDPRPVGVKKLAGSHSDWRVRVGEYRIIYEITDNTILVMRVAHRREVYH